MLMIELLGSSQTKVEQICKKFILTAERVGLCINDEIALYNNKSV